MSKSMWDNEYNTDQYVYGTEPNDFLKEHYAAIPKGKVLLLADGEGRNSVFLAKLGYTVTAVDISSVGLEKAKKLAAKNGVEIDVICEDLQTFDFGEKKWAGIVSISCHLPEKLRKDVFTRVEQGLKSSGVFLLEGYRPEQLEYKTGGPPLAEMMTSKETLTNELPNLTFSHLKELEREVHEGINHHGLAAVIQAIGTPIE
ncbi:class I SAM-dependent methyltransferase [Teredinibacter haidensis]|uniref:class I SAM-dependent methyltransferase n=1 Tax=Teredinibacter haidensis TaxID=2731755 RepID=UPI000A5A2400|nr:class I SAM-dependent methyltransferase [Teredinibacter haidensis]